MPKYPHIKVKLVGKDGNAYAILGRCTNAMKKAGLSETVRDEFRAYAMGGTYNNLLQTCCEWFTIS